MQIGAAAIAATTAVGNLIDVWNDASSTTEEKLVALVAVIPQIGVALSTLQAGIVVLGKSMYIAGAAVAVVAGALTAWKIGIEQMQQARQNEVD